MKIIIFDSSTIINFAMNGLLELLKSLKQNFAGKFIISRDVKREVIDRPINIKKFELAALEVKQLLNEKVLELPESLGIVNSKLEAKKREILKLANKLFSSENQFIKIIHDGEASCLALYLLLEKQGNSCIIAVDERTTRMLAEKPENLKGLLSKKLHSQVKMRNKINLGNIKIIRSTELVYIAYKKNLVNLKNGNVLDALLYATKFKGAAVSDEEIEQIKRL